MTRTRVDAGPEHGGRTRVLMPEQRLALAVLDDGVSAFQRHALVGGPVFDETRDWLFSDDARWPFAFVNVCASLGLEPRYIRSGLAAWLLRAPARHADDTLAETDV